MILFIVTQQWNVFTPSDIIITWARLSLTRRSYIIIVQSKYGVRIYVTYGYLFKATIIDVWGMLWNIEATRLHAEIILSVWKEHALVPIWLSRFKETGLMTVTCIWRSRDIMRSGCKKAYTLSTHWPREDLTAVKLVNFKLSSTINIWRIFCEIASAIPHWSLVNIGSGNGLVASGNKPLPEPVLT